MTLLFRNREQDVQFSTRGPVTLTYIVAFLSSSKVMPVQQNIIYTRTRPLPPAFCAWQQCHSKIGVANLFTDGEFT